MNSRGASPLRLLVLALCVFQRSLAEVVAEDVNGSAIESTTAIVWNVIANIQKDGIVDKSNYERFYGWCHESFGNLSSLHDRHVGLRQRWLAESVADEADAAKLKDEAAALQKEAGADHVAASQATGLAKSEHGRYTTIRRSMLGVAGAVGSAADALEASNAGGQAPDATQAALKNAAKQLKQAAPFVKLLPQEHRRQLAAILRELGSARKDQVVSLPENLLPSMRAYVTKVQSSVHKMEEQDADNSKKYTALVDVKAGAALELTAEGDAKGAAGAEDGLRGAKSKKSLEELQHLVDAEAAYLDEIKGLCAVRATRWRDASKTRAHIETQARRAIATLGGGPSQQNEAALLPPPPPPAPPAPPSFLQQKQQRTKAETSATSAQQPAGSASGEVWQEYLTPEGKAYYYNPATHESQWQAPPQAMIEDHSHPVVATTAAPAATTVAPAQSNPVQAPAGRAVTGIDPIDAIIGDVNVVPLSSADLPTLPSPTTASAVKDVPDMMSSLDADSTEVGPTDDSSGIASTTLAPLSGQESAQSSAAVVASPSNDLNMPTAAQDARSEPLPRSDQTIRNDDPLAMPSPNDATPEDSASSQSMSVEVPFNAPASVQDAEASLDADNMLAEGAAGSTDTEGSGVDAKQRQWCEAELSKNQDDLASKGQHLKKLAADLEAQQQAIGELDESLEILGRDTGGLGALDSALDSLLAAEGSSAASVGNAQRDSEAMLQKAAALLLGVSNAADSRGLRGQAVGSSAPVAAAADVVAGLDTSFQELISLVPKSNAQLQQGQQRLVHFRQLAVAAQAAATQRLHAERNDAAARAESEDVDVGALKKQLANINAYVDKLRSACAGQLPSPSGSDDVKDTWQEYRTPEGKPYYHNVRTGESRWQLS